MAGIRLPKDFLWGFATASYQIEGAAEEDGRADSIWDTFCRQPGKIADGSSGDVACDSYHRFTDDVAILKSLGARAYRFSISWSRVIPLGGRNDPTNPRGIQFYSNLVDALLAEGIQPMVTLFHWDLPQSLEDRYGGFLSQDEFVADFARFARVMFEALGDRVRHWITFNEPWCSAILGYSTGVFAPGHTSDRTKSAVGDSATEPWLVGKSILVAHGTAVELYRGSFKPHQKGQIGITLNGDWTMPWDPNDPADREAAQRKLEFSIAWFADPVYFGDWPESMKRQLGDRLPAFSSSERELIRGSNDFYGMNCYTADFIKHRVGSPTDDDFSGNVDILKSNRAGEVIGSESDVEWLRPNATGFRKLIGWISARYNRPTIYVTENGMPVKGESNMSIEDALKDEPRSQYFRDHIAAMAQAYSLDNVDVRGYVAWSLLDNFEWADGYGPRFGVTYVEYANKQARYPKQSAKTIRDTFASLCTA